MDETIIYKLYTMVKIQRYCGKRVKNGSEVRGYAAVSCESDRAFILEPVISSDDKFFIVEVDPDSLVPVL